MYATVQPCNKGLCFPVRLPQVTQSPPKPARCCWPKSSGANMVLTFAYRTRQETSVLVRIMHALLLIPCQFSYAKTAFAPAQLQP